MSFGVFLEVFMLWDLATLHGVENEEGVQSAAQRRRRREIVISLSPLLFYFPYFINNWCV